MTRKYPCSEHIRTIPEQFHWLDHRVVRNRHIEQLTHEAANLYLFLVTVADSQGLSYSKGQRLAMAPSAAARNCLQQKDGRVATDAESMSLTAIFKQIGGGAL